VLVRDDDGYGDGGDDDGDDDADNAHAHACFCLRVTALKVCCTHRLRQVPDVSTAGIEGGTSKQHSILCPKPKSQNPKPKTQNPKPKTPIPKA